jgi:hypothetical protein
MKEEKAYGIIPASAGAFIFLWSFVIVIAAILIVTMIISSYEPAGIAISLVVIVGLTVLFAAIGYQASHTAFTITDRGLKIGPGMYSWFIPREKIVAAGIKVINLELDKEYAPRWRMNGAGLPGYEAGWFKLKNKEKALLFVTDRSSVVYIPTTENYSVMLSVREADLMVEQIRDWK